ncbi:MAG: hypothetical protein ACO3GO_06015 [Terrimicrobiaceae bacterium]
MDNNDISKLLRLKRYEQPPPEYFENFLAEFQLRQRAEVIHRPFFQIAWDRLCRFLTPPSMPRLAMAGSFAVAVIATGSVLTWSDSETEGLTPTLTQQAPAPSSPSQATKSSPAVQYVLPAEVVTYASARRSF